MIKFLEALVFLWSLCRFLVEVEDLYQSFWILLLLSLRDTCIVDQTLPFFGKTSELASSAIIANMRDMYGILWS